MKRSQLKILIREALSEVLSEKKTAIITTATGTRSIPFDDEKELDPLKKDSNVKSIEDTSGKKIKEGDIDEMANVAIRYQLSPDANAADFVGKKGRIIAAMQAAGEPMSKIDVAAEMGYDKQNPINADFMALVASGAIVPAGEQRAPRFARPQPEPVAAPMGGGDEEDIEDDDEELPAGYENPEGGIEGDMTDAEIDASFARALAGDEEDVDVDDAEIDAAAPASSMSDEDYEAFMQYTDLETRLARIKSDLNREKRGSRMGGEMGDIRGGGSVDLERLRDLKNRTQQKMDDLISRSPYLQARIAKASQPKPEELDEWTINKMKYYAGIIK